MRKKMIDMYYAATRMFVKDFFGSVSFLKGPS
jgi:hypothetical protein